jgi:hypothetical protein
MVIIYVVMMNDTDLDELVDEPTLELGRVDEAVSKVVFDLPSLSVVPTPTPTRVSLVVLS